MEFAIEMAHMTDGLVVQVLEKNKVVGRHDPAVLAKRGLPSRKKDRVHFETEFSRWEAACPDEYFKALSIRPPADVEVKHRVYTTTTTGGLRVFVPALAFMRALLRPQAKVLSAAFTALNIDQLAFVDFVEQVPVARLMLDAGRFYVNHAQNGADRYVKWLMTSRSGRMCAQSVHTNAIQGWLDLDLPLGEFRLAANGVKAGRKFFVTELTALSVKVSADDNLSGQAEVHFLHRNEHVLTDLPPVPGQGLLTDSEWDALSTVLPPGTDRTLIQPILQRLSQGYWGMAEPGQVVAAGLLLQTWGERGTLAKLVGRLREVREGTVAMEPAQLRRLGACHSKAQRRTNAEDARIARMNVFLDTEFATDVDGAVQLLSFGLCSQEGEEFYAEPILTEAPIGGGEFLENEVFPQLGQALGTRGSMIEVAQALAEWLDGLGQGTLQVCYDFNLDFAFVEQLLSMLPGSTRTELLPTHIGYLKDEPSGIQAAEQCWKALEVSRGLRRHHALVDARALRAQFVAVHGA